MSFLAVIERIDLLQPPPVAMARSEPLAISLAPGEATHLSVRFLPARQVEELQREFGGRAQGWLTVVAARYDSGMQWALTPRSGAHSATEALHMTDQGSVSRALIKQAAPGTPQRPLCLDDRGFGYSPGALVPIQGEDGWFARCDKGAWLEAGTFGSPAAAPGRPAPHDQPAR